MTAKYISTDPGTATSFAGTPVSTSSLPIQAQDLTAPESVRPVRVLMFDEHVMFMQGLQSLLGVLRSDLVIDIAATLACALQLLRSATYDLVLLDWPLAECSGEQSIRRLRDSGCMGRIVILSGEMDSALIHSWVENGISGFIPKRYCAEQMLSALDHVLAGRIFLPPDVRAHKLGRIYAAAGVGTDSRFSKLTSRQIEVYRAAARGLSNKLVAKQLGIAETTVKSHLAIVYTILGVKNRTEAAYQASRKATRII